ncbi:hypothetical protein GCM10007874_39360 [Labrys miyagiensis]|uniref:Uncharacterized protein n=1 Tax=Labrys miyagiensis TaxID=346912 RepID=A0ABQ6CL46_9HYPH|nr:hypothetical protein GCM10007874_39360 [Labrys miyagiensis]
MASPNLAASAQMSGRPVGIVNLSRLAPKDGNFPSPGTSHSGALEHVEAGIYKKIAQIDVLVG